MTSPASNKKTDVTIAFIQNYCYFENVQVNGSYVTNFTLSSELSSAALDDPYLSFIYAPDFAMAAAIDLINNDTSILNDVNIRVKRFSDCGGWYPDVKNYFGISGGFASSVMVEDIATNHKDVIAVIGNQYSTTAKGSAEALSLYQIPNCGGGTYSPTLSFKANYPYYFRTVASLGIGDHIYQLLKTWNVKRIAIIYEKDDNMSLQLARDFLESMSRNDVEITANLPTATHVSNETIKYLKTSLLRADARYILIMGLQGYTTEVYINLAKQGMVGSQYVWLGFQYPDASIIDAGDFGYLSGYIIPFTKTYSLNSSWSLELYERMQAIAGFDEEAATLQHLTADLMTGEYVDCVMLMMKGLDKLLKSNENFTPQMLASRQLQRYMNFTLFQNLRYFGYKGNPVELTQHGDLAAPYIFSSYTGNDIDNNFFGETNAEASNFTYYNSSPSIFYGGASRPPLDGPPILEIPEFVPNISNGTGGGILFFSVSGILLSSANVWFTQKNRRKKTILRTSYAFLMLIHISSLMFSVSLVWFIGRPTRLGCHLSMWCKILGFGILMPTLVAKSHMDYTLILSRKRLGRNNRLIYIQAIAIAAAIVGELILLTLWSTQAKPTKVLVFNTLSYTTSYCSDPGYSNPYVIALLVYNLGLALIAIWSAYFSRDAEPLNNESTFPSIITAAFSIAAVLILPVLNVSSPSPTSFLIHTATIWVLVITTQGSVMIPKWASIHADNRKRNAELKSLMALNKSNQRNSSVVAAAVAPKMRNSVTGIPAIAVTEASSFLPQQKRNSESFESPRNWRGILSTAVGGNVVGRISSTRNSNSATAKKVAVDKRPINVQYLVRDPRPSFELHLPDWKLNIFFFVRE
ncbi:periplasmic binding protein-like I [Obelidium mucronatum]|nr:periplasmic binding protein-like I [Obelidium mucronatum]